MRALTNGVNRLFTNTQLFTVVFLWNYNVTKISFHTFQVINSYTHRVHFMIVICLLPTGSEEREVLKVGSIPVAILSSCQDMKSIAL